MYCIHLLCTPVYMYACMDACMYVGICVCMYAAMHVRVFTNGCTCLKCMHVLGIVVGQMKLNINYLAGSDEADTRSPDHVTCPVDLDAIPVCGESEVVAVLHAGRVGWRHEKEGGV